MHFEYIEEQLPNIPILYLNASSLKVTACKRHYAMMVNGYKGEEGDTEQRDIGSAMHKFAEEFTKTGDHAASVLAAIKAWPSGAHYYHRGRGPTTGHRSSTAHSPRRRAAR